jgi:hypothetical protein
MLIAGSPPVLVDELEVGLLERVMRLADRQHVGAGRHQGADAGGRGDRRVGDGQDVGGRAAGMPGVDGRKAGEDAARLGERSQRPDGERPGEQPLAELVGPADRAQRGVQDRDAVAEALGLRQPVRRQEDRDAPAAQLADQLVHVPRGCRV